MGGKLEETSINCDDKKLSNLGKGSYKKAYTINCDKKDMAFTGEDCKNKTLVITNENKDEFYKEIDTQIKLTKKPKIYQYGECKDSDKFDWADNDGIHYKIEEKFTNDLENYRKENLDIIDKLSKDIERGVNFKNAFKELFIQIKHFNKEGYGHFDIKPSNIGVYLSSDGYIDSFNFIDFGFSDKLDTIGFRGTKLFLDPVGYTLNVLYKELDLFALGMSLLKILFDTNPLHNRHVLSKWSDGKLDINLLPLKDEGSDEWISRIYKKRDKIFKYPITANLLYYLFVKDLEYRHSVDEILNHSFWKSTFNNEKDEWTKTPEYDIQQKIILHL